MRQPHDPASQSLVFQNQHEALLPALPRQLRAAGEVTTGSAGESPSVMTKNLGFTREQKGHSMPAQALEEAKHPIDFSLPVRFVPLHSFLGLSPSCGRRGYVGHGLAVTLGHKAQPPEPRLESQRQPQLGYQATGQEDPRRAQQQRPPTVGLARILETHVRWRERKKAAEYSMQFAVSRWVRETRAHGWRGSGGGHRDRAQRHHPHPWQSSHHPTKSATSVQVNYLQDPSIRHAFKC